MTTFTERDAIEIAFTNLEQEKQDRRHELREDMKAIDDRQYFILDRLAAIDAKNVDAVTAGSAIDHLNQIHNEIRETFHAALERKPIVQEIDAEPIVNGLITDAITNANEKQKIASMEAAETIEPVTTFEPIREKTVMADKPNRTKPNRTKPPRAKLTPPRPEHINVQDGAELFVDILKAAAEPIRVKDIAAAVKEKTGREYSNPHGTFGKWMEAAGGRIRKNGPKYSLIEQTGGPQNVQ